MPATMILLIVLLIVLGVALTILRSRIDPTLYSIIIVLIILGVVLWILNAFGLVSLPAQFRLGKG